MNINGYFTRDNGGLSSRNTRIDSCILLLCPYLGFRVVSSPTNLEQEQ